MDGQIPTPNMPNPAERPIGLTPEDLQVGPAAAEMAQPAPASQPAATPPLAAPKLSAADVAAVIAATPTVGTAAPGPAVAADVDLIEPEWVEKADAVVAAHRGDPYAEEEAIQELQQDYLQKRYGIDVADANGDSGKPKRP